MSIFTSSYNIVSNEFSGLLMMADDGSGNGSEPDVNPNPSDEESDPGYEHEPATRSPSISDADDGHRAEDIIDMLKEKSRSEVDQ